MSEETIPVVYKFRGRTADGWAYDNPVLGPREPGVEVDTGKFKLGDGISTWNELPYYLNEDEITTLVNGLIATLPSGGGGGTGDVTSADLLAHINSLTPHPVYDDGPSLLLLYQNAKV